MENTYSYNERGHCLKIDNEGMAHLIHPEKGEIITHISNVVDYIFDKAEDFKPTATAAAYYQPIPETSA